MPELSQMLLEAGAYQYEAPTEQGHTPDPGFWNNVATSVKLQPFWQAFDPANDLGSGIDPDFDPFTPERIKGYEQHAYRFTDAINETHMEAIKSQIDRNTELRAQEQAHGSFLSMMVAEIANPINYFPVPAVAGTGLVRGAASAVALNAPLLAAEEVARTEIDPTATIEEATQNFFYGTVFSGLLGGAVGKLTQKMGQRTNEQGVLYSRQAEEADAVFENAADPVLENRRYDPTALRGTYQRDVWGETDIDLKEARQNLHHSLDDEGKKVMNMIDSLYGPGRMNRYIDAARDTHGKHMTLDVFEDVFKPIIKMHELSNELLPRQIGAVAVRTLGGHAFGHYDPNFKVIRMALNETFFEHPRGDVREGRTDLVFRHEVIHALRHLDLFDEAEWKILEDWSQKHWKKSFDVDARWRDHYAQSMTPERLEQILLEEGIAEAFSYYKRTKKVEPEVKGLFERFEAFLMDIKKRFLRKMGVKQFNITEVEEIFNKIESGEVAARYEARVSELNKRMGFDQLYSMKPVDDPGAAKAWGFENVVKISTMGRLLQSGYRSVADLALRMASDYDIMLERNRNGEASPQSAFLRSLQWHGRSADAIRAANGTYVEYLTDGATTGTEALDLNLSEVTARFVARPGKMKPQEFFHQVTIARVQGKHDNPYVAKAAKQLGDLLDEAKDEAMRVGMFGSKQALAWRRVKLNRMTKAYEAALEGADDLETKLLQERLVELDDELKFIEDRLQWEDVEFNPGQKNYMPLVYDLVAIADDYGNGEASKFRQLVIRKFQSTAAEKGFSTNPEKVAARADEWIQDLLGLGQDIAEFNPNQQTFKGRFRWQNHRVIGFTHDEIADFVETDATRIVHDYFNQFGISVEYAKMFGDRSAEDEIFDALLDAARQGASLDELNKMQDELIKLRDSVLGDRARRIPMSWDKFAADSLKSWAAATMLGRVIKTVIPEVARPFMVNGFARTFGFAFKTFGENLEMQRAMKADLKPWVGEAWDVLMGSAAQRIVTQLGDHGPSESALLNKAIAKGSPWFKFANGPLYIMNLLAPFTQAMKEFQLTSSAQFFIEDIISGANSERLLSHGIDAASQLKIKKLVDDGIIEVSNGLYLPNIGAWDDAELRAVFTSAVAGEVRRVIATAGPGNKAQIMDGYVGPAGSQKRYALLTLPLQFMQFPISSLNKYTLSWAQGRDASPLSGALALVAMGYVSTWLKTPDWAWDKMDEEERLIRAVEQSGLLALFGDVPAMIEQATANKYGIRPLLGLDAKFPVNDELDQASALWGPGGDKIADLYRLLFDGETGSRDKARYLRRSLPLSDLVYWHHIFLQVDPYAEEAIDELR